VIKNRNKAIFKVIMETNENEIKKNTEQTTDKLVVFENSQVRRIFHDGEWYFQFWTLSQY
jgi:hypothetical protein